MNTPLSRPSTLLLSILVLLRSTAIRCPLQQLSRWSAFYTVRLQCTCPISLWSEAGLNMSILILPNKLNHAARCRGEGERWGCWDGRGGDGEPGGRRLSTWAALHPLWSGHPERRISNWLRTSQDELVREGRWPWRNHDGWAIEAVIRDELGRGAAGEGGHAARKTSAWFRKWIQAHFCRRGFYVLVIFKDWSGGTHVGRSWSLDLNIQPDLLFQHLKLKHRRTEAECDDGKTKKENKIEVYSDGSFWHFKRFIWSCCM